MSYIIESTYHDHNQVVIYRRNTLNEANKWSRFLQDNYNVDVEIYTDSAYNKLHPTYITDTTRKCNILTDVV